MSRQDADSKHALEPLASTLVNKGTFVRGYEYVVSGAEVRGKSHGIAKLLPLALFEGLAMTDCWK